MLTHYGFPASREHQSQRVCAGLMQLAGLSALALDQRDRRSRLLQLQYKTGASAAPLCWVLEFIS